MNPEQPDWFHSPASRMARILAAILLAILVLLTGTARTVEAAPQRPAAPAYNAQTFIEELGQLKTGLQNARSSADNLRAYREALPAAWAVDAGGRQYAVPTGLLASRLLKAEQQPEIRGQQIDQARDYLDALAAETASATGRTAQSSDSARAKLNAILARSEYGRSLQQTWWEKVCARINEIISDAIDRLFSRVGGQKPLGYVLLWIGICAAAILIAYWIFRVWFRAAKVAEMALQAAAIPVRSWQEWVFAAREAAGRGDYRGAIHCAYWAGIARLQDLGALAPDRARTPREYLGALSKSRILQPETFAIRKQALSALTARLETIWYGYHPATDADFRDALTQLETLGCHLP